MANFFIYRIDCLTFTTTDAVPFLWSRGCQTDMKTVVTIGTVVVGYIAISFEDF